MCCEGLWIESWSIWSPTTIKSETPRWLPKPHNHELSKPIINEGEEAYKCGSQKFSSAWLVQVAYTRCIVAEVKKWRFPGDWREAENAWRRAERLRKRKWLESCGPHTWLNKKYVLWSDQRAGRSGEIKYGRLYTSHYLILPPSQKKCKSRFSRSQTILILIKFIQKIINICVSE